MNRVRHGIALVGAGVVGLCNVSVPVIFQLLSMVITYYAIRVLLNHVNH